jgi:uncharacterized secreted protein with C-terminal beta-propeller domain
MARQVVTVAVLALVVGLTLGAGAALTAVGPAAPGAPTADTTDDSTGDGWTDGTTRPDTPATGVAELRTFENASAFESYVRQGNLLAESHGPRVRFQAGDDMAVETNVARAETADAATGDGGGDGGGGSTAPSRIANTNVQVGALDEPDLVKTDGRHFYYAPHDRLRELRPVREDVTTDDARPVREPGDVETHVIDASEPATPEAVAEIDTTGKLLQTGETLLVLEGDRVAGYDVSDPENPTEAWSRPLNGSLVTARERDGTLYLVTETPAGPGACPVEPLGGGAVACEDIYRPGTQIPVDATYSAFAIEAASGEIRDSVSFVGAARNSVVYVSEDALYVTYTNPPDRAAVTAEFLREEFDRTPAHLADRVAEIQSYDITPASKQREIRRAFERWVATLPAEERETVREEFREGLSAYVGDHKRDLSRTGVVRVNASDGDLSVGATGTVPGRPLNQFSMDHHDGSLRIATTIPGLGSADSENDLYTLDSETLEARGNVTGMGVTERVYSVRYVGDTAYVVTFRRIDPFHVVDLSDPENPEELGELELPGFSSYLHPVDDDHVLGIGEEDGKVKTVLFDVSDPENPTVADSRVLDRRFSAVANTHHAFLMDRKHGVFVLPAGQRSVVMDYTDESLDTEKTVQTDEPATRARYVDDHLYVFAGESVAIVDERSWERTGTLRLG